MGEQPRPAKMTALQRAEGRTNGRPRIVVTGGIPRGLVILLGLAAAVIAAAGIRAIAWLIGPVFLALTIVIVISPVRTRLIRAGLPRWVATVVLVLTMYAVLITLAVVILVSVAQLATQLPQYAGQSDELVAAVSNAIASLNLGPESLRAAAGSIDLSKVTTFAIALLSDLSGLATNLIFLLSVLLFLALETGGVDARLAVIAEDRPQVATALGGFAKGTRSYMVVTTVFGLIVAVLDTVALFVLGVPLAVLWGLLAFITNYIPNVGFIIGVLPPALLALLSGGWQLMVIVVVVYIGLNFLIQSVVQPRFIGDAVGLSITVTFLALVFWAWLIGPLGAILAIPLTLLAKALLVDIDPRARWADALLGSTPVLPKSQTSQSSSPDSDSPAAKPTVDMTTDDDPP